MEEVVERFYCPEDVEDLCGDLFGALDALKYLYNIPMDHEDAKYRTEELMDAFEGLRNDCEDFIRAHDYYKKAELFNCKTMDQLTAKAIEQASQERKIPGEKG